MEYLTTPLRTPRMYMSENGSAAPSRPMRKIVRSSRAAPTGVEATLNSGRGPWTCMRIVLYASRKISLATSGSVVSNTCAMTIPSHLNKRLDGAGTAVSTLPRKGQRREAGVGMELDRLIMLGLLSDWHRHGQTAS